MAPCSDAFRSLPPPPAPRTVPPSPSRPAGTAISPTAPTRRATGSSISSHAGYGGGGEAIPLVPARIFVPAGGGHDRERIQAALDLVAALPAAADGFRGAVLLGPGQYAIDGSLRLGASGVVLRGSGEGEDGTVLTATGTSRRSLFEVGGRGERQLDPASRQTVTDAPVGATSLTLARAGSFAAGDRIVVQRPSTRAWIAAVGMDTFPGWRPEGRLDWAPGSRDLAWDRVVTAVEGDRLTLDAPLTTALEGRYGGGTVCRCAFPGRIDHVGIEHLRCVSAFDASRPLDEEHAWFCVTLDKVENAWVRQVTALHFVSYVINVRADAKSLTIEDCTALEPVSEPASYRRRVFYTAGQLTLFQRCQSRGGRHDFATGFAAAGPNVFLQCAARDASDFSGPLESWASGVLYDNVLIRGNALRLMNRGITDEGSGWTAANSILWNCEATDIQVQSPAGTSSQAYGCKGDVTDDSLKYDGRLMPYRDFDRGMPIQPASLYLAQLAERKGAAAVAALARQAIPTAPAGLRVLSPAEGDAYVRAEAARKSARVVQPLRVEDARFTIGGQPAWTSGKNWQFFTGQMARSLAPAFGPAITRVAPGETGVGLTDDLEEMAASLPPRSAFYQHYGLWYDRKRINHNYYGAPEHRVADVWAPFMEQPWARSGVGHDWDGMSKYDLTRFNPWFFQRVKDFADLCDSRGLILYENVYFQHPVEETRAHYVDFPWRPVNCLQATDLPDENPAGSTFYDVTHPVRRELHRLYIRHCLDVLQGNANVVYGIDREYSGPLSFVQFWLDTIAGWEKEHHRKVFICLEVPKAEMDAILADPVRGPMITAIDFHDWFYRPDGSLFTIVGGINRAPREQTVNIVSDGEIAALRGRVSNPTYAGANLVSSPEFQRLTQSIRRGTAAMRYRAWREYRDSFPSLVIVPKPDDFPVLTAAIERRIPAAARAQTRPAPLVRNEPESSWCMAAPGRSYLVYAMVGRPADLDLSGDPATYTLAWLDSATGELQPAAAPVVGGKVATLTPPGGVGRPWVAWLVRRAS